MADLVSTSSKLDFSLEVAGLDMDEVSDYGARLLSAWAHVERQRTAVLKQLAAVVVHTRSQFRDDDGVPDWAGKTYDYRVFIGQMYRAADVDPDSQGNMQAAIRYHVGNLLRDVAPPRELRHAGLLESSPKKRALASGGSHATDCESLASALTNELSRLRMSADDKRSDAILAELEETMILVGQRLSELPGN